MHWGVRIGPEVKFEDQLAVFVEHEITACFRDTSKQHIGESLDGPRFCGGLHPPVYWAPMNVSRLGLDFRATLESPVSPSSWTFPDDCGLLVVTDWLITQNSVKTDGSRRVGGRNEASSTGVAAHKIWSSTLYVCLDRLPNHYPVISLLTLSSSSFNIQKDCRTHTRSAGEDLTELIRNHGQRTNWRL